jgi:hypothetical protein
MAHVHITTTELDILPSTVAIIAVIGAYLNIRSANRSQARIARGAYDRDRLTETYIDLLKGVHFRNAQLDDTYSRPMGQAQRAPTKSDFDPTTGDEVLFAARLMAYASPEVDKLWGEFAKRTLEFDNYMVVLRGTAGCPPAELKGAARKKLEETFDKWRERRDELTALIRRELRSQ